MTSKVEEIKIVGVVFKTYIITEFDESIYLIDQHAMHERQLYDNLRKQIEENNVAKQDCSSFSFLIEISTSCNKLSPEWSKKMFPPRRFLSFLSSD